MYSRSELHYPTNAQLSLSRHTYNSLATARISKPGLCMLNTIRIKDFMAVIRKESLKLTLKVQYITMTTLTLQSLYKRSMLKWKHNILLLLLLS